MTVHKLVLCLCIICPSVSPATPARKGRGYTHDIFYRKWHLQQSNEIPLLSSQIHTHATTWIYQTTFTKQLTVTHSTLSAKYHLVHRLGRGSLQICFIFPWFHITRVGFSQDFPLLSSINWWKPHLPLSLCLSHTRTIQPLTYQGEQQTATEVSLWVIHKTLGTFLRICRSSETWIKLQCLVTTAQL